MTAQEALRDGDPDQPAPPDGAGWSPRRLPTLEVVAEAAGVSRATVSRVVNGSPRVSPAARAAVATAVAQLGYVPNRAARSLVTRRTGLIALIVDERPGAPCSDVLLAGLPCGVTTALVETDLQLVLLHVRDVPQRDRALRYVAAGHVDGVLLLAAGDDLRNALVAAGVPLVTEPLGTEPPGTDTFGTEFPVTKPPVPRPPATEPRVAEPVVTAPLRSDAPGERDRWQAERTGAEMTRGLLARLARCGGAERAPRDTPY